MRKNTPSQELSDWLVAEMRKNEDKEKRELPDSIVESDSSLL